MILYSNYRGTPTPTPYPPNILQPHSDASSAPTAPLSSPLTLGGLDACVNKNMFNNLPLWWNIMISGFYSLYYEYATS